MLNIYVGMEEAIAMFHEDRGSDAVETLERLVAAVLDYNEELSDGEGDVDMDFDIELMMQLRDVLVGNGAIAPPPEVMEIPEDPWPAD